MDVIDVPFEVVVILVQVIFCDSTHTIRVGLVGSVGLSRCVCV